MAKVKKHQSRTGSFAWRRWQPNLFGRFCKDNEGAAAVEFALIAFPFFLMMGGIFEFTFHFYVNRLLDNAVEDVSRKIRTKQITAANFNEATFKQEMCDLPYMTVFNCGDLTVDVRVIGQFQELGVPRDPNGNFNSAGLGFNPGGRVSINVVRAFYEWPTFIAFHRFSADQVWSNGSRLMVSSKAFRVEP